MKQVIVNVAWENSAFDGTFFNEFGMGELRIIEHDFYNFVDMVLWGFEVRSAGWLECEGEYPDWYKKKEYEFVYNFKDVASILKAYTSYVSLAAISRVTGINQTLLSHYANGLKIPRRKQQERIIAGLHEIGLELNRLTCN